MKLPAKREVAQRRNYMPTPFAQVVFGGLRWDMTPQQDPLSGVISYSMQEQGTAVKGELHRRNLQFNYTRGCGGCQ